MNLAALKSEMITDPSSIDYGPYYALRDSVTLSSMLNNPDGSAK